MNTTSPEAEPKKSQKDHTSLVDANTLDSIGILLATAAGFQQLLPRCKYQHAEGLLRDETIPEVKRTTAASDILRRDISLVRKMLGALEDAECLLTGATIDKILNESIAPPEPERDHGT